MPAYLRNLKGQCHEIFCFRFFSWITFPQAPENNIRVISNFESVFVYEYIHEFESKTAKALIVVKGTCAGPIDKLNRKTGLSVMSFKAASVLD